MKMLIRKLLDPPNRPACPAQQPNEATTLRNPQEPVLLSDIGLRDVLIVSGRDNGAQLGA